VRCPSLGLTKLVAQLLRGLLAPALQLGDLGPQRVELLELIAHRLQLGLPALELLLARLQLVAPGGLRVDHPLEQMLQLVAPPLGAVELHAGLSEPLLEPGDAPGRAAAHVGAGVQRHVPVALLARQLALTIPRNMRILRNMHDFPTECAA
jgi:hypothetical protein